MMIDQHALKSQRWELPLVVLFWLLAFAVFGLAAATGSAERAHVLIITGMSLAGLGFAALCYWRGWFAQPPDPFHSPTMRGLWGGGTAALIPVFIEHFGMRQFGGFDHSPLVDLGWRMVNGQQPYRDFACSLPVGFMLGAFHAYQWLGVSWHSLVTLTAIASTALFLWSSALLAAILPNRFTAFVLALCIQTSTLMLAAYWWYNPITTASACVYLLSALLFLERPRCALAQFSYFASLLLLATMKPNIAGVLILGVSGVLFFSAQHRWRVVALSAAAFGSFLLLLAVHHLSLVDVLTSYTGIAQRGLSFHQFLQDLSPREQALSLVGAVLVLLPFLGSKPGRTALFGGGARQMIALTACLAGFYGFLTNGELKLVDMPLPLLGAFFYTTLPTSENRSGWRKAPGWSEYTSLLAAVFLFIGLGQGITRHRVMVIGPFFEFQTTSQPVPNAYFAGVTTGEGFIEVITNVGAVLAKHPGARVYFGPRMQWAYAAFNLPSPKGQPLWWHPGVAFPILDQSRYMTAWAADRFDLLIFYRKKDISHFVQDYYAPEFLHLMETLYNVDNTVPKLTVLTAKP